MSKKLNSLLTKWQKNEVITARALERMKISPQLAKKYVKSGWLHRVGNGAYARSQDDVSWKGALQAMQSQLGMSVHVGGQSALKLHGRAHFLPMNIYGTVTLISDGGERLPTWFKNYSWVVAFSHHAISLFDTPSSKTLSIHRDEGVQISISTPERAILEEIRLASTNLEIEHAHLLLEGLTTLRPAVVQELLEKCKSKKVKRFFLWSAHQAGHSWVSKLDETKLDLGKGKRQFYKGGTFDSRYNLTVPKTEEMPNV